LDSPFDLRKYQESDISTAGKRLVPVVR